MHTRWTVLFLSNTITTKLQHLSHALIRIEAGLTWTNLYTSITVGVAKKTELHRTTINHRLKVLGLEQIVGTTRDARVQFLCAAGLLLILHRLQSTRTHTQTGSQRCAAQYSGRVAQ